jgi:uncharacterized protein (DUF934 family)
MTRRIILDRSIVDDLWHLMPEGETVPAAGKIIVPLATWLGHYADFSARACDVGVWLSPTTSLASSPAMSPACP